MLLRLDPFDGLHRTTHTDETHPDGDQHQQRQKDKNAASLALVEPLHLYHCASLDNQSLR